MAETGAAGDLEDARQESLRIAVVHGRGFDRDPERKQAGIDALIQQCLGPYGYGDRIDRIEVSLIKYDDVLRDARQDAGDRGGRRSPSVQFPVAKRVPRVKGSPLSARCQHCQELDWKARTLVSLLRAGSFFAWPARAYVAARMNDVNLYLSDVRVRSAVTEAVHDRLVDIRPHVVIAHSLGSIVALDVLSFSHTPQPSLLITAGSPLSMPWVAENLPKAAAAWLATPQSAWLNVHDRTDTITGGRHIETRPGTPVSVVTNLEVNNDDNRSRALVTHDLEPHLQHPQVAQAIAFMADHPGADPQLVHKRVVRILQAPRSRNGRATSDH